MFHSLLLFLQKISLFVPTKNKSFRLNRRKHMTRSEYVLVVSTHCLHVGRQKNNITWVSCRDSNSRREIRSLMFQQQGTLKFRIRQVFCSIVEWAAKLNLGPSISTSWAPTNWVDLRCTWDSSQQGHTTGLNTTCKLVRSIYARGGVLNSAPEGTSLDQNIDISTTTASVPELLRYALVTFETIEPQPLYKVLPRSKLGFTTYVLVHIHPCMPLCPMK